jgi:hypothetical protein
MARNQTRRLKPAVFQADENGFAALQSMTNYSPANHVYSTKAIAAARDEVDALRRVEVQAAASATVARAKAVAREWDFHNLMLGAKEQVIAQFGVDSDELESLGRKKKSAYKPPGRKAMGKK